VVNLYTYQNSHAVWKNIFNVKIKVVFDPKLVLRDKIGKAH